MIFSREYILEATERILKVLPDDCLEKMVGKRIDFPNSNEFISFDISYSNGENPFNITFYKGKGTIPPFEIKVNQKRNHAHIILRANHLFKGYDRIVADDFGNIAQYRTLNSASLPVIINELLELSKK